MILLCSWSCLFSSKSFNGSLPHSVKSKFHFKAAKTPTPALLSSFCPFSLTHLAPASLVSVSSFIPSMLPLQIICTHYCSLCSDCSSLETCIICSHSIQVPVSVPPKQRILMLSVDRYICSKSIKANTGMINNIFNIMMTSSLGRKEGNEVKIETKEETFNSICTVL